MGVLNGIWPIRKVLLQQCPKCVSHVASPGTSAENVFVKQKLRELVSLLLKFVALCCVTFSYRHCVCLA